MENLTTQVARNLRRMRAEQKLSLDQLAARAGVSKSMLGQIERGASSPTIAMLWKIATGLGTSFTSLLEAPQTDTVIVSTQKLQPLTGDNGRYRIFPLFPAESGRRFEIYTMEIARGGRHKAEAHSEGTQEFLTVSAGELAIRAGDNEFRVAAGDAIRFRADQPHAYMNYGKVLTRASLVIFYSR